MPGGRSFDGIAVFSIAGRSPVPIIRRRELPLFVESAEQPPLEVTMKWVTRERPRRFANDHEQIQHGFVVYDALYAWAREARDEKHTWNPQRVA